MKLDFMIGVKGSALVLDGEVEAITKSTEKLASPDRSVSNSDVTYDLPPQSDALVLTKDAQDSRKGDAPSGVAVGF